MIFTQVLNWVSMAATVDCQEETSGNIYYLNKKLKNSFLTEIIFIIYESGIKIGEEKGFYYLKSKKGGTHGRLLH